jgi:hypothetical protein
MNDGSERRRRRSEQVVWFAYNWRLVVDKACLMDGLIAIDCFIGLAVAVGWLRLVACNSPDNS